MSDVLREIDVLDRFLLNIKNVVNIKSNIKQMYEFTVRKDSFL